MGFFPVDISFLFASSSGGTACSWGDEDAYLGELVAGSRGSGGGLVAVSAGCCGFEPLPGAFGSGAPCSGASGSGASGAGFVGASVAGVSAISVSAAGG